MTVLGKTYRLQSTFGSTSTIECIECSTGVRSLQDCLEEMVHSGIASYSAHLQCLHFCQTEEMFKHFFTVNR